MDQNETFESLFTALRKAEAKGQNLYRVKFSVPSADLDRYHRNVERQVFALRQRIAELFPGVVLGGPIKVSELIDQTIQFRLAMIYAQSNAYACDEPDHFFFSDWIQTPWGTEPYDYSQEAAEW